jgi:type I restriction enzyme S subunit
VRLIQLADVGVGNFRDRSARFMTMEAARRLNCTFLRPSDVLIARMPDPLGRACIFPGVDQQAVTAVDVMIWRTDGQLAASEWFARWLNSPDVRTAMLAAAGGTTRQRIAGGRIKEMEIPFPPAAEQRRIVAKLDALTARLVRARGELKQIEILALRMEACVYQEFDCGDRNESLLSLLGFPIRNGLSVKGSDQRPGVAALRLSALRTGVIDLADVRYLPIDEQRAGPYLLRDGDILVSRGNGTLSFVGRSARVSMPEDAEPTIFPDTAFRLRLDKTRADSRWLTQVWNSPMVRTQIEARARTTAGIWKISQRDLAEIRLPKLSLDQQQRAANLMETAFARVHRLEAEAARARALIDRLESAILAKAFRGELVPQDPNDEPASMLLERIRAQRAAAPKPQRASRARAL